MVECLTLVAGILARNAGVFKGTGADRRFVKNAFKNAELPTLIIENHSSQVLFVSYNSQRLPLQIKNHTSLLDKNTYPPHTQTT